MISITGQVLDLHSVLGLVPIEGFRIDPLSRDGIPVVLRGLQLIRCDEGKRERLMVSVCASRCALPPERRAA